jgi:hypothetical protein
MVVGEICFDVNGDNVMGSVTHCFLGTSTNSSKKTMYHELNYFVIYDGFFWQLLVFMGSFDCCDVPRCIVCLLVGCV